MTPLHLWHTQCMSEKHSDSFIKVRLNSLNPNEPIPFDLYVHIGEKQIHYLRSGDKLSLEKLSKFENKAPDSFFVKASERAHYKKYVHNQLAGDSLTVEQKAVMLRESSLTLVEELFESPDIQEALEGSKEIPPHLGICRPYG